MYLTEAGRRIFLKNFEGRMNDPVAHPDLAESVSYRRAIALQVERYKRFLRDGVSYVPFLRPS